MLPDMQQIRQRHLAAILFDQGGLAELSSCALLTCINENEPQGTRVPRFGKGRVAKWRRAVSATIQAGFLEGISLGFAKSANQLG
jgi:hypothetical protein